MVKIKIPLPADTTFGGESESVWAEEVEPGLFRIKNVPFFAKGLSFDDLVLAEEQNGELTFKDVARHSGHSTYRIFASQGRHRPEVVALLERLGEMHCTYEPATGKLVGIDVQPEADIYQVYATLEEAEKNGVADFDEGHCGHTLRA